MKKSIQAFIKGMGSILELIPSRSKPKFTPLLQSDYEALQSDWQMVGNDLQTAIDSAKNGNQRTK